MAAVLVLAFLALSAAAVADPDKDYDDRCFVKSDGEHNGDPIQDVPIDMPVGVFVYEYETDPDVCSNYSGLTVVICDSGRWYTPGPFIEFNSTGVTITRLIPDTEANFVVGYYCDDE